MGTLRNLPTSVAGELLTVPDVASLPTDVGMGAVRYVEDIDRVYTFDGSTWQALAGGVDGPNPASSTDNAVVRWDGTGGNTLQNSGVTISDTNAVAGATTINATGTITGNAFSAGGFDGTDEYALYGSAPGKFVTESATTKVELEFLSGVTSSVQTQLNDKIDGAGVSTDNALPRWDGAGGDTLQNSGVIVDDSDNLDVPGNIDGADITASGTLASGDLAGGFALISSGTAIDESAVTATELGYVSGVTSAIQTQLNAKVDDSEKGSAGGVATLDGGGKVPASQLPNSVMDYQGTWAASTNTPTLANGVGSAGDVYVASDAGTVDFGAGNITFAAGDWVIYSGAIWEKSINSNAVASVNGFTGAVVLDTNDIAEDTNLYFTDERAQDAVGAMVDDSTKVSLTYNDGTPSLVADIVAGSLVNADINTSAAIARSKLGTGSVDHVVINDGSGNFSSEASLAISRGGTGQATATAGFDALSPTTTRGDVIVRGASNNVRLAAATDNRVLRGDGTDVISGQIDDPAFFTAGAAATAASPGIFVNPSIVAATFSDIALTSNVPANAASISLNKGIYIVVGKLNVDFTSATTFTSAIASISTTSATRHAPSTVRDTGSSNTAARFVGTSRILTVSADATSVYLVAEVTYTGGADVRSEADGGQLQAIKIGIVD